MEHPDMEMDEIEESWREHPMTIEATKALSKRVEKALGGLMSACRVTSDPAVARAHAQFVVFSEVFKGFGGKNA